MSRSAELFDKARKAYEVALKSAMAEARKEFPLGARVIWCDGFRFGKPSYETGVVREHPPHAYGHFICRASGGRDQHVSPTNLELIREEKPA